MSMTGPTLRAAGLAYDNRRVFPYSSYEEFQFDVPTRTDSDCFARYMVRVAEMRESLKIIRQAIDKITPRAFSHGGRGNHPSRAGKNEDGDGALILPLQNFHRRILAAPGQAFAAIESPRGELGVFGSDGSPKPLRVHFRGPSFM